MNLHRPTEDEIFRIAYELNTPDARIAYLKQVCRDDVEVERIVALLKEGSAEASFLENGPVDMAMTESLPAGTNLSGESIGPYKLLQPIGEGGFGVVYMAEQLSPVRRKVALKVIKPGMDSKQVVARFEAERQALALMDHPNVARVFDGGSTDAGRPYFVMELVKGVPITEFCDENKLDVRGRLELFATVCRAIQHAHHKGVIHRDIKPSNVLVTLHDGKPVPKVIDFGVSKAISQQLTEKTMFTAHGQMIGTPQYMSPEQAEMSGLDIDTRSDVYSLGILVYELLTGGTPLDPRKIRETGYAEMQRLIKEQESLKPSTSLSTHGDQLAIIAGRRGTDPNRLSQFLRGDLDWIVMKAIEKERNRRYETASNFAADVERFLEDEPVEACPPSITYKLRKFARRNRGPVTAGALIALTLLLGIIGTTAGLIRANRNAHQLNREVQLSARLATQAEASQRAAEKEEAKAKLQEEQLRRENYFQMVSLAQVAMEKGRPAEALQQLAKCPDDLRHWEWYYMDRLARSDRLESQQLLDLPGRVLACAWNPVDPDSAVVVTDDGSATALRITETRITRRHLLKIDGHYNEIFTAQNGGVNLWFDPTGNEIALPNGPDGFTLVDVHSGNILGSLCGQTGALAFAFNPNPIQQQIATGGADGQIRFWSRDGTALPHPEMSHGDNWIFDVTYSPNGSLIASGDSDGNVAIWSAKSGQRQCMLKAHRPPVSAMAFSHDGKLLATASLDHTVKLWNVATGSFVRELTGHTDSIFGLSFCSDEDHEDGDTRLATSSNDGTVRLWQVETGREVFKLTQKTRVLGRLAFDPNGKRLIAAINDKRLTVWDATPGAVQTDPAIEFSPKGRVFDVEVHRDGNLVASAGEDGVRIWDLVTRKERFHARKQISFDVAFHPHQALIASVHLRDRENQAERGAIVLNMDDGTVARRMEWNDDQLGDHGADIRGDISPNGKWIATGGRRGARVWNLNDMQTEEPIFELNPVERLAWAIKFSPCSRFLVIRSGEEVLLFETEHFGNDHPGRNLATIRHGSMAWQIGFSPDGETIAVTDLGNLILLPTAENSTAPQVSWQVSMDWVSCTAFSPDGQYIATAGSDETIRIWHVATQQLVRAFVEGSKVFCLAFSPDGKALVSGSQGKNVSVWDTSFLTQ